MNDEEGVILLEGTRLIVNDEYHCLTDIGRHLALFFSKYVFRSGNAVGSDAAFTDGVIEVCQKRMEIIVPYKTHRSKAIPSQAKLLSLDDLDFSELVEIKNISIKANPDRARLVKFYLPGSNSVLSIKASYLLRDVLKLTGLMSKNFNITSAAIFHSHSNQISGGTLHTMKVCKYLGIPQFDTKQFFFRKNWN